MPLPGFMNKGLAGAWLPILGHVMDLSGNGNHGAFGTPLAADWQNIGGMWHYNPHDINGRLSIPYNANRDVNALTYILAGDFSDVKNAAWRYPFSNTNRIDLDRGNGRILHYGSVDIGGWWGSLPTTARVLTITHPTGHAQGRLYRDGVSYGLSGSYAVGNPVSPTQILYKTGSVRRSPILACLEYNVEKTADEVAEISEYLNSLTSPRIGTKHFLLGGSNPLMIGDFGQIVASTATLVAGDVIDSGLEMKVGDLASVKVIAEEIDGEITKRFETLTVGVARIAFDIPEENSGYGTWETHLWLPTNASSVWSSSCAILNPDCTGYEGYFFMIFPGGIVNLAKYVTGVYLGTTVINATPIAYNANIRLRVTRDHLGVFNFYYNGAYWGTHTDTTLTSGRRGLLHSNTAGAKFSIDSERHTNQLFHLKDVVPPQL